MADSFETLKSSLISGLQAIESPDEVDDLTKIRLVETIDKLRPLVEPPASAVINLTSGSHGITATRIAIDMGVFDVFAENGNSKMTLDQLDQKTKGDKALLFRILRFLSVAGLMRQISLNEWQPTPLGSGFPTAGVPAQMVIHFYDQLQSHASLLDFLQATNFEDPKHTFKSPWQYGLRTDKHYFEWIQEDKIREHSFNVTMAIQSSMQAQNWYDYFPVEERLKVGADDVLLVDVGGGVGLVSLPFREKYPDLPGRVVLEDLPHVVSEVKTPFPKDFETRSYDMFTPQPIKNAKAYYLRTVLHDWPDEEALKILKRIREAMGKESILLVNEGVIPEEGLSKIATCVDFVMMNCFAARERTQKDWMHLIQSAGFTVVQVWRPTGTQTFPYMLFEAVAE